MLVTVKQQEHTDCFGRVFKHNVLCMRCDVCGKEWEKRGSKIRVASRKTHSCSSECKSLAHMNGGIVERQRAATCFERFGAENPFAAEPCKRKMRQTWKAKYGTEHGPGSPAIRKKALNTMHERYGEHPQSNPEIVKKRRRTMFENWGVDYPMQLAHVREAMMSGSVVKFGVPYPMQSVENQKRVFEQRDGISWMSKPEKVFRVMLEERYGKENVKVQRLLERRWSINFYVTTIDTWVSFDGVYWHGLDRPIDQIRLSTKPRDKAIYEKWSKDRELDAYAEDKCMRLVRITDVEFKTDPEACLLKVEGR